MIRSVSHFVDKNSRRQKNSPPVKNRCRQTVFSAECNISLSSLVGEFIIYSSLTRSFYSSIQGTLVASFSMVRDLQAGGERNHFSCRGTTQSVLSKLQIYSLLKGCRVSCSLFGVFCSFTVAGTHDHVSLKHKSTRLQRGAS